MAIDKSISCYQFNSYMSHIFVKFMSLDEIFKITKKACNRSLHLSCITWGHSTGVERIFLQGILSNYL